MCKNKIAEFGFFHQKTFGPDFPTARAEGARRAQRAGLALGAPRRQAAGLFTGGTPPGRPRSRRDRRCLLRPGARLQSPALPRAPRRQRVPGLAHRRTRKQRGHQTGRERGGRSASKKQGENCWPTHGAVGAPTAASRLGALRVGARRAGTRRRARGAATVAHAPRRRSRVTAAWKTAPGSFLPSVRPGAALLAGKAERNVTQPDGEGAANATPRPRRLARRSRGRQTRGEGLPPGSGPLRRLRRSRRNSLSKREPPLNEPSVSNGWKYFVHSAAPSVPLCRGRGLQAKAGTKRPSVAPVSTEEFKEGDEWAQELMNDKAVWSQSASYACMWHSNPPSLLPQREVSKLQKKKGGRLGGACMRAGF